MWVGIPLFSSGEAGADSGKSNLGFCWFDWACLVAGFHGLNNRPELVVARRGDDFGCCSQQ